MAGRNDNPNLSYITDWDTFTVLRKRKTTADDFKRQKREGNTESVVKSGVDGAVAHQNFKLDSSNEAAKIERVSKETAQAIIKARAAKKLNQEGLARQLGLKKQIIQEIENGKAPVKNNKDLAKVKRFLGVK